MKKVLLFAAVAVFGLAFVNAQEMKFGAKVGVNFASITGDMTEDLSGLTGFHIGGYVDIPVSEKFSVQPELQFSTQGAEENFEDEFEKEEGKIKLNYLNIPVMAKFKVAEGFSVQAGPQIGFLLSAKNEYSFTDKVDPGFGNDESGEEDIKDFIKSTDFGINFGLGYEMASGLNFSARYNLGLSNIYDFDNDVDPDFGIGEIKNQNSVIQLSVGYSF